MATLWETSQCFFDSLILDNKDKSKEENLTDKICFKNALKQFLNSGKKEDAFTVYFCFSEIFKLFGKGYENTKKLLEMLSDHEYHSGELLSKHRDHYSHSVYVFALGLAIYANDNFFKKTYDKFYKLNNKYSESNFLKHWGLVALFHDIGYPFQLAHEQVKTYSEEVWGKNNPMNPFVSYGNMKNFLHIDEEIQKHLSTPFGDKKFEDLNELLAYGLNAREHYDEKMVCEILYKRVVEQPAFMDHGYFSAIILARQLFSCPNFEFNMQRLDVLTAILLHNNFNKYDAPNKHKIALLEHPLAYLLILCDELQCWDRRAYGKISKRDPIAYDVSLRISDNDIYIKYRYDSYFVRIEEDLKTIAKINKNYEEMINGIFVNKIFNYIESPLKLDVETIEKSKLKKSKLYISDDSFINLCDLAKAIHISYDKHCKEYSKNHIETNFDNLSLEFKVSNIEQAKSYGEKLELINCFYSSKDLDYPVVNDFSRTEYSAFKNNLGFLSREEHVRWVKEKLAMGWKYGTDYDPNDRLERERKKIHRCLVPYEELSEEDRSKDELMIANIIPLLRKFDSNIRIYNYRIGRKPNLEIAGAGHRFIKGDAQTIARYKKEIKDILKKYSEDYRVVLRSCFAYGADQLIAECAIELGLTVKADLPMGYEDFIKDVKQDTLKNGYPFTEEDELRMRHLLAQTVVCKPIPDSVHTYAAASQYIIDKCSKLIVLWDEKKTPLYDKQHNPINRGGTYDTIRMAREAKYTDKDIHIISCQR